MGEVDRIFTDELGWMFTRNQVREYGIDGHALVVRGDGLVTWRMLATQVKGGASRFRRATVGGPGGRFGRTTSICTTGSAITCRCWWSWSAR